MFHTEAFTTLLDSGQPKRQAEQLAELARKVDGLRECHPSAFVTWLQSSAGAKYIRTVVTAIVSYEIPFNVGTAVHITKEAHDRSASDEQDAAILSQFGNEDYAILRFSEDRHSVFLDHPTLSAVPISLNAIEKAKSE